MPSRYSGRVEELPAAIRLDRYVAEKLGLLTRSQIKARALEGRINGRTAKLSSPVKAGDVLDLSWALPEPEELLPEDRALDLLYEDDRVVVVNKPQGMVVHPGAGNRCGTLANALLARRLIRGGAGKGFRPGIVHRLDKDTSGVIIAAYDDESLAFLVDQFKSRTVRKLYNAVVLGVLPAVEGRIITRISRDSRNRKRFAAQDAAHDAAQNGKIAVSFYRVLRSWGSSCSLVALRPRTGRTHQLRVHMAYLGCPILGDPIYNTGRRRVSGTLMLHAKSLSVVLPGEAEPRTFTSPLPARFLEFFGKHT